ncbi:(d)CMP kinase [Clostridium thermosuccinogenes]|uniref:(d)CMP kinase n=1 Tax=Clostridium thermosuccinogenes TaxID=84032 RepID=UPI000CCC69C4|nr:(d)CMP kinase [Pseudoclostridium thermosuccinogenes]PNT93071.1 cytidylate kinase [Pseudoclostridium thermosuccinogenes]
MGNIQVAIDGPAGAGKSTIAKLVSRRMGIIYIDTGAMYRAVALKAIRQGINTQDRERVSQMVNNIDIKIEHAGNEQVIYLDGEDVSGKIRTPEVSVGASNVASIPEVRLKMVDLQRKIARSSSVVMDGRDIGTYVLPDAKYKFFLTASVEERAKRRYQELVEKGITNISLEEVKKDIEYRDMNDASRELAPLVKAKDAIEIDTTCLTAEEVADKIMVHIGESKC